MESLRTFNVENIYEDDLDECLESLEQLDEESKMNKGYIENGEQVTCYECKGNFIHDDIHPTDETGSEPHCYDCTENYIKKKQGGLQTVFHLSKKRKIN